MSSLRSRSGGSLKQTPLIRKYSSFRNRPALTSGSRSCELEEISRVERAASPWRFSLSESKERSARWQAESNSSTLSRKREPAGEGLKSPGESVSNCRSNWAGSITEQLTFLSGASELPDNRCRSLAYTSFPVPLSPSSNTGMFVRAISTTAAFSDARVFPCPKTKLGSAVRSRICAGAFIFSHRGSAGRRRAQPSKRRSLLHGGERQLTYHKPTLQ